MNLSDVIQRVMRRRCVEVGTNGVILFSGLDERGIPFEIRITVLEKSGRRLRALLEAPDSIKIDHAG